MTRQVRLYGATIKEVIDRLYHIEVDAETMLHILNEAKVDKKKLLELLKKELES